MAWPHAPVVKPKPTLEDAESVTGGNELHVVNGSVHGRGIYTARISNPQQRAQGSRVQGLKGSGWEDGVSVLFFESGFFLSIQQLRARLELDYAARLMFMWFSEPGTTHQAFGRIL